MPEPIDFYFDFSSPYGYFASQQIDAIAARHGRSVEWRPVLLGAIFKLTGTQPLVQIPIKGDYYRHDFSRTARFKNIAFNYPSVFPIAAIHASRAFYWLRDRDAAQARALANRYYHAFFVEDLDISRLDNTLGLAAEIGVDGTALENALTDPAAKDRLKREVDAAIGRGVWGSPFFFNGEPFMGSDRLDQVEHWLSTGGW